MKAIIIIAYFNLLENFIFWVFFDGLKRENFTLVVDLPIEKILEIDEISINYQKIIFIPLITHQNYPKHEKVINMMKKIFLDTLKMMTKKRRKMIKNL